MFRQYIVLVVSVLAASVVGFAGPITYSGTLTNGVLVVGSTSQAAGSSGSPDGAVYYDFSAVAGDAITVTGHRTDAAFDMSFWLFSGIFADTSVFGGFFDSTDAPFSIFADDELPPALPGPFGDPQAVFVAPFTGLYTVAVTNFDSGDEEDSIAQATSLGFNLLMTDDPTASIPEPGTFGLMGFAAIAFGAFRFARRS